MCIKNFINCSYYDSAQDCNLAGLPEPNKKLDRPWEGPLKAGSGPVFREVKISGRAWVKVDGNRPTGNRRCLLK